MLQSLNGSVNAIWVGRFLGESALAATSNANVIMFLMFSAVFGFGMAATILIGQQVGRGDMGEARRAFGTALGMVGIAAIVIALAGWLFTHQILVALATPGDALPLAEAYLRMLFLSLPASMVVVLMSMGLRGVGDSITPFWFMAAGVLLDSALNPVFIIGLGPIPAMGIAGSGFATLVANHLVLAGMVAWLHWRDAPLALKGADIRLLIPQADLMRTVIAKGLPMGAQILVVSTAALGMMGLVNREGVDVSAAYGVTQQLWAYVQMPAMAIGAAVTAMAAQNIGAGRWDRVERITGAGIILNVAMTGLAVIAILLFDREVMALFLGADSPAVPIGRHIQLVATWGFILFGITMVLFGAVRANGEVLAPLIVLGISMYPIRLGFANAMLPHWGADALWWSFPAGSVSAVIMAALYYRYGNWRSRAMMAGPAAATARQPASTPAQ